MQIKEIIEISVSKESKIELLYEGDNIYSVIKTSKLNTPEQEESSICLSREELFDISLKVFPNLG